MSNTDLQNNREQARRESVKNGVIFHGGTVSAAGGVRQATSASAGKEKAEKGWGWEFGRGMVDFAENIVDEAGKRISKTSQSGPAVAKHLGNFANKVPGRVMDAFEIATAPDKVRAGVKMAGGAAGGAAGRAAGAAAGAEAGAAIGSIVPGVGTAAGAVVGGVAGGVTGGVAGDWGGSEGAGALYDRRDDIAREFKRGYDATVRGFGEAAMSGYGPGGTDARVRRLFLRY